MKLNVCLSYQHISEALIGTSCLSSLTHVDDKCQWLSRVVFNQFLLVGCEELRVFHVLQGEVTFMRLHLLFLCLILRERGAVSRVEDFIQEELHRGLLGLARWRGWAGDHRLGKH